MNKIIIYFLFVVLLTGCEPTVNSSNNNEPTTLKRLSSELSLNKQIIEIKNPKFKLPRDIFREQIKKTFRIGDVYFALAIKPNSNITFDQPIKRPTKFVGILISNWKERSWQKYIEVKNDGNNGNIPYYLWSNNEGIYLTVVDDKGDAKFKGNMKLLRSEAGEDWVVSKCYEFGDKYISFDKSGDYFKYSKFLDKHTEQDMNNCNNLKFKIY